MIAKDGEGEDGEETRERERGEDREKRREKTWERSEASECEGRANRHKHVTRLVRVQTCKSSQVTMWQSRQLTDLWQQWPTPCRHCQGSLERTCLHAKNNNNIVYSSTQNT